MIIQIIHGVSEGVYVLTSFLVLYPGETLVSWEALVSYFGK